MTPEQFSYMALGVLIAVVFWAVYWKVDRTINPPKNKFPSCPHERLRCENCNRSFVRPLRR